MPRREVEGFVQCTYNNGMFSTEKEVYFPAIGGPRADGGAPHYDSISKLGELMSPADYLLRRDGKNYTSDLGEIEDKETKTEGLLKVIKTDEQDGKSMIGVRCAWTGYKNSFVIKTENFIPKESVRVRTNKISV